VPNPILHWVRQSLFHSFTLALFSHIKKSDQEQFALLSFTKAATFAKRVTVSKLKKEPP